MNKILSDILGVLGIIALGVLVTVGVLSFLTYQKQVKNQAMFYCSTASKYEVKDGKATVSYAVKELYEKCLSDMGIK